MAWHFSRFRRVAFGFAVLLIAQICRAEEPYYDFLRGLHDENHGEMAVLYLNSIKDRADLPDEMKSTFDLEMARSLRIAAAETPNADLQQKYVLEAQQSLDKFLKENAAHDEAAGAYVTSGDISLMRAQTLMKVALRKKSEKETLMPEARKFLEEARPKYLKGAELFKARVDKAAEDKTGVGKKKKFKSNRAANEYVELVENWTNARFKVATVDYNVGLTYSDPKDPNRKKILQQSALGFDTLFQENRTGRTGIYAHMWEGKVQEEMEAFQTALDIYDEVMSAQPDDKDSKKRAQWFAMFNGVNRFRLMLLGRNKEYGKLITDAEIWLAQNNRVEKTSGYQGIALELAKGYLEFAKSAKGDDVAKAQKRAKDLLEKIVKQPSEFQKDAILVRRQMQGADAEALNTFDDAIAVADAASKAAAESATSEEIKKNWTEAEKAYSKAVELSGTVKDKNRVLLTRFAQAQSQFMVGKSAEAYDNAMKLAKENPQFAKAPAAAALGVQVALYLYGQTKDAPALERINDCTEFVLKTWPQHAEADDARIARGKLKLIQADYKGAIDIFLGVNPASDRYPSALQFASQTHWAMYQQAKAKGDAAKPDDVQALRTKAVELAQKCIAAFEKIEVKGPLAQTRNEAHLLMAEIRIEENQHEEAAKLLLPLFSELKNQLPSVFDRYTVRLLVFSLKTFAALEKTAEASEVGQLLVTSGEDTPVINGMVIEYAKIAKVDWKKAAAEVIVAEQKGEEGLLNNTKQAEEAAREKYSKLLEQLAARKQYDLGGLLFLADNSADIGLMDKARDLYQTIVDRAAADPAFAKKSQAAVINAQAKLIGVLRQEEKYAEALTQVEALLKARPNALEPMLEKGNILQALAEKDPKEYEKAVNWWGTLPNKLRAAPGKKPPEYYEVVYKCATCLIAQKQPTSYEKAHRLLSSTLAISPNLDGPDRVELYKVLQKQIPDSAKKAPAAATKTKTAAKTK